jgi:ssDNA-binding Zn-finger/Zn-ribbon topoisomerase 1
MPTRDEYPLGEERRLFYVALTRARRAVVMFTARGHCSEFLRELEADGAVTITDTDGKPLREEICPSCKQGVLVLRTGPYSEFRSCSNFPACTYKPEKRVGRRSISFGMHELGSGVEKDAIQAVSWDRKAAEQGYARGQSNLGVMYAEGSGVEKDASQAVYWFRKAAEQGHADGQFYLGLMYGNGSGIEEDATQAVFWFRKAAEQGHELAKTKLSAI